jgi:hypothetical protein
MIIAIDFDGTCVTHEYPKIGKDIGAVPVLKRLVSQGHKLILFTMRDDKIKKPKDPTERIKLEEYLQEAVEWFGANAIPLFGIQLNPGQKHWTTSNKCYAELYIDDAALGCPIKYDLNIAERPFVDWEAVERLLIEKQILR